MKEEIKKLFVDFYKTYEIGVFKLYTIIIDENKNQKLFLKYLKKHISAIDITVINKNLFYFLEKNYLMNFTDYFLLVLKGFENINDDILLDFFKKLYFKQKKVSDYLKENNLSIIFLMHLQTFLKIKEYCKNQNLNNAIFLNNTFWEGDY